MATLTFTEETDNVQSVIKKSASTNTDELVLTVPNTTTINIGDTVNYRDKDSTVIFQGKVESLKIGATKEATVYDLGFQLQKRIVNKTYQNQSPEAIIQDIITNFSSGLTYTSTISSGKSIALYVAKDKLAWDVITEMCEILLANFMTDASGNFNVELKGDTLSSKSINTTNAILDGDWEEDKSNLVNSATVVAERQIFEHDPELFSGDGSTTDFVLQEIPFDILVEHPVGTVKTGSVDGSTGDYTVDKETKTVKFGTAPASGTNNIQITYSYEIPVKIRRRDLASITAYGQHDKRFEVSYIKNRNEARDYANFILDKFKEPLQFSTWIMTSVSDYNDYTSFEPNQIINVNDTIYGITGDFLIMEVEREYPGDLKIKVGESSDSIFDYDKEVAKRIKQLEEKDNNSDLITEDEFISEEVQITFTIDICDAIKRTYDSDTFYLEEATGGSRNQMLNSGAGDIMRELGSGYTDEPIFTQTRITENGDTRITEGGDTRITE